jgi:GNAT superfamily N-acetyltransferase
LRDDELDVKREEDSATFAIPLRGKVLNVEKMREYSKFIYQIRDDYTVEYEKMTNTHKHRIILSDVVRQKNHNVWCPNKPRHFCMMKVAPKLGKITIKNTTPAHAQSIADCVRRAYRVPEDDPCPGCLGVPAVLEQLKRFPEGQFVAVLPDESGGDLVVGSAHTMLTTRPPDAPTLTWMDMIGGKGIPNHEPDGDWLYGVEMVVRPHYRRRGIGSALYRARFDLVRRLNLKGWYAVGMLMGYHRFQDSMTVSEYGERVLNEELRDPTVSMQINRGFRPVRVVENYLDEEDAGDAGVLIIWDNPDWRKPDDVEAST